MENFTILENELIGKGFNGVNEIYKHLSGRRFSSGVHLLREQFNCFWLIDDVLFEYFGNPLLFKEDFLSWNLERIYENDLPTNSFTLSVDDGNGNIIGSKIIPYSDFKHDKVRLWWENDLLYIPAER